MKRKIPLSLLAIVIAILSTFATDLSAPAFTLKALAGTPVPSCQNAMNLVGGQNCAVRSSGTACTVTVGGTSGLQAYDGVCDDNHAIKYTIP